MVHTIKNGPCSAHDDYILAIRHKHSFYDVIRKSRYKLAWKQGQYFIDGNFYHQTATKHETYLHKQIYRENKALPHVRIV